MSLPVASYIRRSRTAGNTPIGSANPTVTSLDAIRDDPRTPQREWSVLETILLEGQEHPLRRTHSVASLRQEAPPTPDNAVRRWSRAARYSGVDEHRDAPGGDGYFNQSTRPLSEPVVIGEPLNASIPITTEPEESDMSDEDVDSPTFVQQRTYQPQFSCLPSLTTLQRDVLKCSMAYFIGSLFTFNPYLSSLIVDIIPSRAPLGPSPSGHMVATVTVYFNPAKSLGGMQEADIYCMMAALFSGFVALASMDTFWFFEIQPGWEWLADLLTFIWIAVAMAAVAWVKVWMNKASFGPAASMASIIIFVTVIKEGGLHVLLQVVFIVLIGSLISNMICILVWPRSASKAFQSDIVNSLNSFAVLLEMLTRTFLLEENLHPQHAKLLRAVKDHEATFTSLKRSLSEAKSEWWNSRIQRSSEAYDTAISTLTRLAQHVGGLRSGLNLQRELALHGGKTRISQSLVDSIEVDALERAFGEFVDELGPPMHALTSTCVKTLKKLKDSSHQQASGRLAQALEFDDLVASIRRALFTFDSTSTHALSRMFRREGEEHRNGVGANTGIDDGSETLCLVYFFIFNLQEFASELIGLAEVMGYIHDLDRSKSGWLAKMRNWIPLNARRATLNGDVAVKPGLKRRISSFGPVDSRRDPPRSKLFPPVMPHAPNTVNRPPLESLSFIDRQKQRLWDLGHQLKDPELRYAIKTGAATAILALPAFLDSTRELFVRYRGEWALISFFVVSSKTIGGTNQLALHRILGTIIGAITAATITTIFPRQPYVLAAFGLLFSIPCFRVIVGQPQYATSGRFVLLTYNLTCLFRYNMRAEDASVWTIAWHRSMAVTIGVLWALIVTRWWWPSEARRELTRGLSELCLNMSWLYTSLVKTWPSKELSSVRTMLVQDENVDSEQQPLLGAGGIRSPSAEIRRFMEMELHLQLHLLELQSLVAQAASEFRLKGPFPVSLYRGILASLQTILDNLHSIRCVSMREEWRSTGHSNVIRAVQPERRAMVGNVLLYFSTLSAAFGLKAPLSPYLPPAEDARRRLVEAIRKVAAARHLETQGSSSRQLLYIAYVLMMKSVISELGFLGATLQTAYGVIGDGSFEDIFAVREERRRR